MGTEMVLILWEIDNIVTTKKIGKWAINRSIRRLLIAVFGLTSLKFVSIR